MTTLLHPRDHHVVDGVRALDEELAALVHAPVWSMSATDAEDTLVILARVRSRLDALTLRVLRHAQAVDAGTDGDAATTVAWWAQETRTTRAAAHRAARLAEALDRHDEVAEHLRTGRLRTDQAQVIVDAVDDLPADVEAWVPGAATGFLLDKAGEHDAKALRVLGRRVLEVVDPDAADTDEARRLEAEEADAHAKASFTMTDDGHGSCHGRFTIPSLHGQMLRQHLLAITSPTRHPNGDAPDATHRTDLAGASAASGAAEAAGASEASAAAGDGVGERPLTRHRLGQAFVEYLETRPTHTVPHSGGGVPATVVVTMELDTLLGGLKAASLDTGGRISAGEARRLACRAGIIPVVLGGPSVVLDVGRRRRFHTETQRIAMAVRDRGCTAHGCDVPPGRCHAHHDGMSWGHGAGTSVEHGRLLCPRHHHRIHDPAYQHTLDKHGKVRFTRRT